MRLLTFLILVLPALLPAQNEKATIEYDSTSKVLRRIRRVETVAIIDTNLMKNERARLVRQRDLIQVKIDSLDSQYATALKLMGKKKGGGNGNRQKKEATPAAPEIAQPQKPAKVKAKKKKG